MNCSFTTASTREGSLSYGALHPQCAADDGFTSAYVGLINIKHHGPKPLIIVTPRIRKHADGVRPNLALFYPYLDGEKKRDWQN